MSKEIIIVKLGGSMVTLKHAHKPAIRREHLTRIARILKKYYRPECHALILIHGAGSFGHLHAHQHSLALGTKDHPNKLFRAIENQSLDARLNSALTSIFIQNKLPVVGILTRAIAFNHNGSLSTLRPESIEEAVRTGAIPLLHGDMVFDKAWGLSVCSGDVLMAELARHFRVTTVFLASDVDGIFSEDPHRSKTAKLIPALNLDDLYTKSQLTVSHNTDVTGGLSKKFSHFHTVKPLKNIFFFNGLKSENFTYLFDRQKFTGTLIRKK